MYRKILAAIDGSSGARLALDEALKVAAASDAAVTAVYVLEHAVRAVDVGSSFTDEQEDSAQAEAALAAMEQARALFDERHVRGLVRAIDACGESIASVLNSAAAECRADLIVMGTQGRHGLKRTLLGSVAESTLRTADLPVLLVRHDPTVEKIPSMVATIMYRKILVAVDGSESSKAAIAEALRMAEFARAHVHAVYVVHPWGLSYPGYYEPEALAKVLREDGRAALDEARKAMAGHDVSRNVEIDETQGAQDTIAQSLLRCAQRQGADLVMMGTHGKHGLRRVVLGSVAEEFLRISTCPVLIVHN
jgi:nucleotide-binding universal stress UspA family protein